MAPLKKGHSRDVVSGNIKEMIRAGHPKTQAVAAALASARKYKKMAQGGMVGSSEEYNDDEDPNVPHQGHDAMRSAPLETPMRPMDEKGPEDYERSLYALSLEGESHPEEVANPNEMNEAQMFAQALRKKASQDLSPENYAMGGLVQPEQGMPLGNKPDENRADSTEEPLSAMPMKPDGLEHAGVGDPSGMGLSMEAKAALEKKKKMRRYSQS